MPNEEPQGTQVDLDRVITRFGNRIAQAEMAAEVAEQRAAQIEQEKRELERVISDLVDQLEHDQHDQKGETDEQQ